MARRDEYGQIGLQLVAGERAKLDALSAHYGLHAQGVLHLLIAREHSRVSAEHAQPLAEGEEVEPDHLLVLEVIDSSDTPPAGPVTREQIAKRLGWPAPQLRALPRVLNDLVRAGYAARVDAEGRTPASVPPHYLVTAAGLRRLVGEGEEQS